MVWLLRIPGLLAVGGALLVWIAWKLLQPDEGSESVESHAPVVTGFWSAMRTVIIADALMGLDNVLAVAGAAHGNLLLVVLGLAISVPIVMWGSTLVLKVVERYPAVVYFGSGVLVWTAVTMMLNEKLFNEWLMAQGVPLRALYLTVPLLLGAAFFRNHRQARVAHPCAAEGDGRTRSRQPRSPPQRRRTTAMLKVLVPIEGSENSLNACAPCGRGNRRDHSAEAAPAARAAAAVASHLAVSSARATATLAPRARRSGAGQARELPSEPACPTRSSG